MAIAHARLEFLKRSNNKNACCKAAYNSRGKVKFEGHNFSPPKTYNWSYKDPCVFHEILLPSYVDQSFKSPEKLWNAAEAIEVKKNSQVAMEIVIALPDDKCISIEDRIELTKTFVQKNFIDKGLAAQIDIHPPDKKIHLSPESGEVENVDHNWHAHVLIPTRKFSPDGKSLAEKARNLMPDVKTVKSAGNIYVNGEHWGKTWEAHQNCYFEERGIDLTVDPTGIISQNHLGPVRMRGRVYELLSENNLRQELNQAEAQNPHELLKHITKYKSVFTPKDLKDLLNKFVEEKKHSLIEEAFWKQKEILPLIDSEGELSDHFTTHEILSQEKRILNFSDSIQKKSPLKLTSHSEQFTDELSPEQKDAYSKIISGSRLSCIGGFAGTGKSHLLVAIKKTYELDGYTVRAFGPDAATSKVLEEKGFSSAENLHRFLFYLHNQKREVTNGKEIWIVDEASKIGNSVMTQLLKSAKEKSVQLIFSGDQSQMGAVERGCMYKTFCERYGSADLLEIKRQKREKDREISKKIATGKTSEAIDEIIRTGGIIWDNTRMDSIEQLIKSWAQDRESFPNETSLIITHSQAERKALNEMVRIYRMEKGEIESKEFECSMGDKKIYVSVGDVIEFSKNDKTLAVTNGMRGTLIKASLDEFVVAINDEEGRREVCFNPEEYSSFQLGYATTYHRSQGKTIDRAYVLHSPRLNKESFYVGLTRHVQKAYLFIPKDNIHYLAYLKAKACGLDTSGKYNKRLYEAMFKTESDYESSLKEQARSTESKLSAKDFQTERESLILELKNAESLSSNVKGYALSAWDKIAGVVKGKSYAKQADHDFYNPEIKPEEKSIVTELGISSQTIESVKEIKLNPALVLKPIESQLSKQDTSPPKVIKHTIQLNDSQKLSLKNYFDCNDQAKALQILSTQEGKNDIKYSSYFDEWMNTCKKRNEFAHQVVHTISKNDLRSVLGKNGLDILCEKSRKHELLLDREQNKPINLDAQLKDNIESLLSKLFPEGPSRRNRKSYRYGSKGSLVVQIEGEEKGAFYDHENQVGGGPLALIQKTCQLDFSEAKEWAAAFLGKPENLKPLVRPTNFKPNQKEAFWISKKPLISNPAPSLKQLSFNLDKRFNEVARYPYYNKEGEILFYVLRLSDNVNPKNKSFLHLSFGQNRGEENEKWALKGYQCDKKPLYNLPELLKGGKKTILIVEGEKAAEAAAKLFSDEEITCVTWSGGASAVTKTDWSPLFQKQVIVWPDNDKAGIRAGESICSELRKLGVKSLHMLEKELLEKYFPEKWDLADPLPEGLKSDQVKDLLFKATEKSIGFDQVALGVKENTGVVDKARMNEILWRLEQRIRPNLEKELNSMQINHEIQKEFMQILNSEEKIQNLLKGSGINGQIAQSIVLQAMLYQAETGKNLSSTGLENVRKHLQTIDIQNLNQQISKDSSLSSEMKKEILSYLIDGKLSDKIQMTQEQKRPLDVQALIKDELLKEASKDMTHQNSV